MQKLYKSRTDVKISGVCAGIAEYFKIDPTIVRLATGISILFGGAGILAYIVCAVVMPQAPENHQDNAERDENHPHSN